MPNEPSWRSEDTVRLAPILYAHGVDLLDVSSGGNHYHQRIKGGPSYQAPFALAVKKALGATSIYPSPKDNTLGTDPSKPPSRLIVSTVGTITSGVQAEGLLANGSADVIMVGRYFQKHPSLVWDWADELGVKMRVANQIRWAFEGRGKKTNGKERL